MIVIAVLATCVTLFAAEADQFRLLATLPQEHVQTFAVSGNCVYVLSSGNLTTLDAAVPGLKFRVVKAIPIDKSLVEIAASERAIALASRNGIVEIYERTGGHLVFRSRANLGDSVLAMQIYDNQLYVAQGFAGTRVMDITELSNPTTTAVLTESDYASAVAVAADFLYVLDHLNGVTVYSRSGDTFSFSDEIPTELPPIDIGAAKFGVVICFGTGRLEYWFCSKFHAPLLQVNPTFEFDINCLAANRSGFGTILLGGVTGEVVDYDPVHENITARRNLGYPVDQLVIVQDLSSAPYVALDRAGNISVISDDGDLQITKSYMSENSIGTVVASGDGLIMSNSRGIEIVETSGGKASVRSLIPGFPICDALAESGPYLFAATNGIISVFRKERGEYGFIAEIESEVTVRNLFMNIRSDDKRELIAVGQEGVRSFEFGDDDNFVPNISADTRYPIVCSDLAGGLLTLGAENGAAVILNVTTSITKWVALIQTREHLRDLALVEGRFLVVANSGGLQIFRFEDNGIYAELDPPNSVPSAFDLHYDPDSRELLIADGSSPVKYLDFSDPERLGVVYLIANSEGTAKIAYSNDRLYCLATNWLRSFERKTASADSQASSQLEHSIYAAPNPFNSSTEISVTLDTRTILPQPVTVTLVNVLGQTIARKHVLTGTHAMSLNLSDLVTPDSQLPSGIYLCRVAAAGSLVTQKLLLLK